MDTKSIPIEWGAKRRFVWRTDKWGRAEFVICPVYQRGYIRKLFINPLQQGGDHYELWADVTGKVRAVGITSYDGLADAKVWMLPWCSEHKCQAIRLYVPRDSGSLVIERWSNEIGVEFRR